MALDARCKEQEAKTQKKLTDKWLGPLYKPKVYAGADKTQEMLSRTERLFKGESALEKSEVQKALRQQRRSRMAAS